MEKTSSSSSSSSSMKDRHSTDELELGPYNDDTPSAPMIDADQGRAERRRSWDTGLREPAHTAPKKRRAALYYVGGIFAAILLIVLYTTRPPTILRGPSDVEKPIEDDARIPPDSLAPGQTSKYAYVSLLSSENNRPKDEDPDNDEMFESLRMLTYQLLYAPETRSEGIPFIVLAVPGTSEAKKDRLRKDGAIVKEIDTVEIPAWIWTHGDVQAQWYHMFDKLRLLEMDEYDRVLFIDADHVIAHPMHGVFEEAVVQHTNFDHANETDLAAGVRLPSEYVFVAGYELHHEHDFPPTEEDHYLGSYFNAGFMLFWPSREMQAYYLAFLNQPESFDKVDMMEQSLLNQIHRPEGPMPFQVLDPIWNVHFGMKNDLDHGVHSIHAKWWFFPHQDVVDFMMQWRWRAKGFFEGWDAS